MRVISQTELFLLTRAQLFSLLTQMQAVLADLPEDSVEHQFVAATLVNIKLVLARKAPSP